MKISDSLQENINQLKNAFGNSSDFVVRELQLGPNYEYSIALVYMDVMIDSTALFRLITSVSSQLNQLESSAHTGVLSNLLIPVSESKMHSEFDSVYKAILSGDTVMFAEGDNSAISVSTKGYESRSVTEPISQTVVRGPQEGFTEAIATNVSLIRRKIKDPNLRYETKEIGRITKTNIGLMYIKGIVKDNVLQELNERLQKIDIDGILESNYIEELIQDRRRTVFPTVYNTERPDVAAAELLEGKIAILVDGTPFVLIIPALFTQFVQSAEDYYHRSDFGILRLLRYIAIFLSLLAPATYIALTTFHQEMLPTPMLISLAAQREGIPFPAFIEALIMEITFEFLREAGVRMPRAVGSAISIVGALVLGQAAVDASLVSPAMVIIVSITAISGFIFPSYDFGISLRILRFIFMALAAAFGLYGIFIGLMALVLHISHLQSFGVPYMSPFAPFVAADQKDVILRVPWWRMNTRPSVLVKSNKVRQNSQNASRGENKHEGDNI